MEDLQMLPRFEKFALLATLLLAFTVSAQAAFVTNQAASVVIGQPDMTSGGKIKAEVGAARVREPSARQGVFLQTVLGFMWLTH